MALSIIIRIMLLSFCFMGIASPQPYPCFYSREDYLPCMYRKNHKRAGDNEYSIHYTNIKPNMRCKVRPVRFFESVSEITDFGTEEMRVIYSPGYAEEQYDNKLRVEYKIRCQQNEVAYYNMTYLDIQGRDCEDSDGRMVCQDYVWVIRGQGGYVEECGNTISALSLSQLVFEGFDVVFRTSEVNVSEGFQMYIVCSKPEEASLPGSFEVSEFTYTPPSLGKRCDCEAHKPYPPPVIDPQGLLPDADEEIELIKMYTPILDSIKTTDDSRNNRSCDFDESDIEAVLAALRSRESSNAVLRAQSRATLTYYNALDEQCVMDLSTFNISCDLNKNVLTCTNHSDSTILRHRTMCKLQIDGQPPVSDACDPFFEGFDMSTFTSVNVTAINSIGQTATLCCSKQTGLCNVCMTTFPFWTNI